MSDKGMSDIKERMRYVADTLDDFYDKRGKLDGMKLATELREKKLLEQRIAELEQDARRLDHLEAHWQDGIHVELCAVAGPGETLVPKATIFYRNREDSASTIREAIDAAIADHPDSQQ